MKGLLLTAALVCLCLVVHVRAAAAASCPAPLAHAELREMDLDDELTRYAVLRWLYCGPQAVETELPALRETINAHARAEAEKEASEYLGDPPPQLNPDDAFARQVIVVLSFNPAVLIDELAQAPDDIDRKGAAPQQWAEYFRLRVSRAQMLRHYEQGVGRAIEFLRHEALSPQQEQLLELILVAQEVRQGQIAPARAHLVRVAAAAADIADLPPAEDDADAKEYDEMLQGQLENLTAVLAAVPSIPPAASGQRWILNRAIGVPRRHRSSVVAAFVALFGPDYLRAEVLRRADSDAAITEKLRAEWNGLIEGDSSSPLLLELLRKRYRGGELQTALDDALASVYSKNGTAGLMLFGQALPLPGAVIEGNATVPDGTKERPLEVAELVALVQASDLYRRLSPAQQPVETKID